MRRNLTVLFAFTLLGLLALNAWALTTDELGAHLIRLLNRGITQGLLTEDEERTLVRIIFKSGVDYIPNATYTTLATRREACRDIARGLYQAITGIDVTSGAALKHFYRGHWLTTEGGVTPSDVSAVDDGN